MTDDPTPVADVLPVDGMTAGAEPVADDVADDDELPPDDGPETD